MERIAQVKGCHSQDLMLLRPVALLPEAPAHATVLVSHVQAPRPIGNKGVEGLDLTCKPSSSNPKWTTFEAQI